MNTRKLFKVYLIFCLAFEKELVNLKKPLNKISSKIYIDYFF